MKTGTMMPMVVADEQINVIGKRLMLRSDIGDDLLAVAYLRFQQEGLLPIIFHNHHPGITLQQFLDWHRQYDMEAQACFLEDTGTGNLELAGIGWINSVREHGGDRICEVGLGFFKEFQRPGFTREFTTMLLDHVFMVRKYSACYGISPVNNRAIHRFARSMGFKATCELPFFCGWGGEATSAVMYFMTANDWLQGGL